MGDIVIEQIPESRSADRLRVLYIYLILQKYSDPDHPIGTTRIQELLRQEYQISIHRETVPKYMKMLEEAGVNVEQRRLRSYVYWMNQTESPFSSTEIKLLIDAVQASHFITEEHSEKIIRKLVGVVSEPMADQLERSIHITGRVKSDNEIGLSIVEAVNAAILAGKKITFTYSDYAIDKKVEKRNNGKPYTVSPYDLIWNGDFYYIIGFCDEHHEVRTFRMDRIDAIPEQTRKKGVPKPMSYSVEHYTKDSFRMYAAQIPEKVTLNCQRQAMNAVIDHFGIDVDTEVVDTDHFQAKVTVCVGPTFFRWVFGWNGKIRIEGPAAVKMAYVHMLKDALNSISD